MSLSYNATKLLFRDKRLRLTLLDGTQQKTLLDFCTYVQWVPSSDIIVAQSGNILYVWYNASVPDQVTLVTIKGEAETVLRDADRTEVIVQEANARVAYELDRDQVDGSTIESGDLAKTAAFLDQCRAAVDSDFNKIYNVEKIAQVALDQGNLSIAWRCFAALGDFGKAQAAFKVMELAEIDGTQSSKVKTRLAQLRHQFKKAENIFLEKVNISKAYNHSPSPVNHRRMDCWINFF
ncbi:unnamed protein product, partial [Cylicostephanus goldi]